MTGKQRWRQGDGGELEKGDGGGRASGPGDGEGVEKGDSQPNTPPLHHQGPNCAVVLPFLYQIPVAHGCFDAHYTRKFSFSGNMYMKI